MNTFPGRETAPVLRVRRCLLLKITRRNGYLPPDLSGEMIHFTAYLAFIQPKNFLVTNESFTFSKFALYTVR